jgi:hypothetical protein
MAEQPPPTWLLLSVLFSSVQLTPSLAATLHQTALDLWRRGARSAEVAGDAVSGRVENLEKELLLGTIAGPAFEARLETARGPGRVRFLLTRQGLELMAEQQAPPAAAKPRYLN